MTMSDDATRAALERLMQAAPSAQHGRVALRTGRDDRLEYTNAPEAVPDWSMTDDDTVRDLIEDRLFDENEETWEYLTSNGHAIGATHRALANFKREMQQQLNARRVKADALWQECRSDPDRQQEWLEFETRHQDWRRRAIYVDNRIAKLLSYVRDRRRVVNRAHDQGVHRRAWELLAKAITEHRDSAAPDRDAQLYAALETTTVHEDRSIADVMSYWTH